MMYDAVGIHVFAGGFTMGVQRVMNVKCQLEQHGFGQETCEALCKVPFVNVPSADWPDVEAQFAYGNPRCTGFSTITAGYDSDTHGPWAKQCEDIHTLCRYAAGRFDVIVWESVQQAFSTGRPLLDYIRDEYFVPKGYRIAHVLINAASFGNAQQRKRYFFVAYRDNLKFNIEPPLLASPYEPVLWDAIKHLRGRETHEEVRGEGYDFDTYTRLGPDEAALVPHMPNGWCMNAMAEFAYEIIPESMKRVWDTRASNMPFSMHCVSRLCYFRPCSTLHSSCGRWLHPEYDRPITYGELSTVMGWPDIPRGNGPCAQMAKGVVPDVGEWLAKQAQHCLNGYWGTDDWESTYNPNTCTWDGDDATGKVEKTFNLTKYCGHVFDIERFPQELVNKNHSRWHKLRLRRKRNGTFL